MDKGLIIHDQILQPGVVSNFVYNYNKKDVSSITYRAVYDDKALEIDLDRVKATKNARDQRRKQDGFWLALGVFIDQYFFSGTFSTLFEIGNYGLMLFNGATSDQWADALFDSAVGLGIDNTFDKNYQKGLAKGAYELAKSIQPQEYKDLQNWLAYFMRLRESGYTRTGYIGETAKLPIKKVKLYPHMSLSGAYPIFQHFTETEFDDDIRLAVFSTDIPLDVRLSYLQTPYLGYYAEYGRTGAFKNRDNLNYSYIIQSNAVKFQTFGVGILQSYKFLEVGMGFSVIHMEKYLIEEVTNSLKFSESKIKFGASFEPKINVQLSNYITVFSAYKLTLFSDASMSSS